MEDAKRKQFRELWADLGPKMQSKQLGRDTEVEEIFMLGWAIGLQEGMKIGVDEAVAITRSIRTGQP